MPRIRHFIRDFDPKKDPIPLEDLKKIPAIAPERFVREKHGVAAIRRWLKQNQPENFKEEVNSAEAKLLNPEAYDNQGSFIFYQKKQQSNYSATNDMGEPPSKKPPSSSKKSIKALSAKTPKKIKKKLKDKA